MPIVAGDILFKFSGASGTPATSIGGAIHATSITDATLHNLFDVVSSAETTSGDTEYRCFYVKNNHGTLTLEAAKIWIETDTPAAGSDIEIALGTSAINGTEQTIVNESTAPTGVTWQSSAGVGNALTIGNIPAGQHKAIWLKRVISAGAAAYNTDSCVIKVSGDTAA